MEPELGKVEVEARDRSMEEAVTEKIRLTAAKNEEEDDTHEQGGKKLPVLTFAFG